MWVVVAAQGHAQAAAATPSVSVDAATRRAVIDTVAAELGRVYLDADTGQLIADRIRQRAASGAYDGITDPYRFAELASADLRAVNGDKHLSLQFDPDAHADHVGLDGIHMAGGDGPTPPEVEAEERRDHYGIGRLDVLPGNVGYLDLRSFAQSQAAHDAIVIALRYLESTDAIIIDLRRNGGGSGEMSNFLISHFTGADSVLSLRIVNRSAHETIDRWTMAKVPGPRRPEVPLYLLTGGNTASGAEDFAFVLHNLGRATLIGDRTAGAGHNVAFVDAGHGFVTAISFTRVSDPRTGREWERVGIQPDVQTDVERALDVAHASVVARLAEHATGHDHELLTLLQEYLDAGLHPRAVPAARLNRYAGVYEAGRTISVVRGGLTYRARPGFLAVDLVPLSDSLFARGVNRFSFEHDAHGAIVLRMTVPGAGSLTYPRLDTRRTAADVGAGR